MAKKYYKEKDENVGSEIYCQRISNLRFEKQITLDELSEKTGVPKPTISAWIKGKYTPNIKGLSEIAKALNVSVDYLIGNTEVRPLNIKLQAVCNYTGLSEEAVRTLHNWVVAGTENGDEEAKKRTEHLNHLLSLNETKIFLLALFDCCNESEAYAEEIYNAINSTDCDDILFLTDKPNGDVEDSFNSCIGNLFFGDRVKSKQKCDKENELEYMTFRNTQRLTKIIEKLRTEHLKKSKELFIKKLKESEK